MAYQSGLSLSEEGVQWVGASVLSDGSVSARCVGLIGLLGRLKQKPSKHAFSRRACRSERPTRFGS